MKHRKQISIDTILAVLFPVAVLLYSATFYLVGPSNIIYGLLTILFGIVAVIGTLVQFVRRRDQLATLCLLGVVIVWLMWVLLPTRQLGMQTRFWMEKTTYDESVAQLKADKVIDCLVADTCKIDPGPPKRLVFSWGGIIDNWIGVVFDPTDGVAQPDRHKGLFGGDLVSCQRMTENYYICSFT
ncbi:MAG: hypothetical protein GY703_13345 [Gammaproteobacteria bacterium]|nr:hypothetical protein [Gammaproteobacteria bacterium]